MPDDQVAREKRTQIAATRRDREKAAGRTRWTRRLNMGSGILVLCVIAGECGQVHWFPDLFSHFQVHYLVLAATLLLLSGLLKHWRQLMVTSGLCLWFGWQLSPMWLDTVRHTNEAANLRIVSANLFAGNSDSDRVLDVLRESEADIVVLQEVTPDAARVLKRVVDILPHQEVVPREDAFGMAVLSRLEFEWIRTFDVGDVPWMDAELRSGTSRFRILATHTLPPMSRPYATTRNRQLGEISVAAQRARDAGVELIVAGDLNCTRWSPWMEKTLAESELASARSGFGVTASWPTNNPLLMIPIDHVLVSSGIRVRDFRLGEATGSDHLPVVADLVLPQTSP